MMELTAAFIAGVLVAILLTLLNISAELQEIRKGPASGVLTPAPNAPASNPDPHAQGSQASRKLPYQH